MSQAEISPRREVQYKRIGKVSIPLLALLASFFVVSMPGPTYAEMDCSGEESGVTIDDGEMTINSGSIDPNTISFELDNDEERATLTLTNYNGGSICIHDERYDIFLKLEGENNITDSLVSEGSIIIEGDGALSVEANLEADNLFVKSGVIDSLYMASAHLRILGGKVSTKVAAAYTAFYQQAGELNIESSNAPFCLYAEFVVFNGGTADIDCTGAPAIISRSRGGSMYDEIVGERTAETDGNITHVFEYEKGELYSDYYKPLHGSILFNDGDISLKSDIAAIVFLLESNKDNPFDPNAEAFLGQKGKDYFIMIADGMLVNGAEPVVDAFVNSDENAIYSTFTDGTIGAMISASGDTKYEETTFSASPNILKAVRISKNGTPVPSADGNEEEEDTEEDEENPNTVDTKIVGIALGTLFAIIAEGVIIGDLYRRLFSYEKEIANIDEKSDYTSDKA